VIEAPAAAAVQGLRGIGSCCLASSGGPELLLLLLPLLLAVWLNAFRQ
jgi:hypothetical protein